MAEVPVSATRSAKNLDVSPSSLGAGGRRVSFSAAAPATLVLLAPDSHDIPNGVEIIAEVGLKNDTAASKYDATSRDSAPSLFDCHKSPQTASEVFGQALQKVSSSMRSPGTADNKQRAPRSSGSKETAPTPSSTSSSGSKKALSMRNMTANDLVRIRRLKSQDFTQLRKNRRRQSLSRANTPSQRPANGSEGPTVAERADRAARRASTGALDDLGPALALMFSPSTASNDSDSTVDTPATSARSWQLTVTNDDVASASAGLPTPGPRSRSPQPLTAGDKRYSWSGPTSGSESGRPPLSPRSRSRSPRSPRGPANPPSPRASPLRSLSESMTVVIGQARRPAEDDELASLDEKLTQLNFPGTPSRSPSGGSLASSSASSMSSQSSLSPRRLESNSSGDSVSSVSRLPPLSGRRRSSLDAMLSWQKIQEPSLRRSASKVKDSFGDVLAQVKKAMDQGKTTTPPTETTRA